MSDYFKITTSGNIFAKVSAELRTRIRTYGDEYARTVAEIFVDRARQKLVSAYPNTSKLTDNIFFQRSVGYGNYRIGLKNNDTKDVMFYLEFGTGIVGRENPHPEARAYGWEYAINEDKVFQGLGGQELPMYFDLTKPVGQQGLYSLNAPTPDPAKGVKGWIYKTPTGNLVATSGLKAVRYIYDTLQEIDDIKAEAERRLKDGK